MPRGIPAAALALLLTPHPAASADEIGEVLAEVRSLRRQVVLLESALRERDERLDALKKDVGALGDDVAAIKERMTPPVAGTFLSGPPPSSDAVGFAKVAVFAPRVEVDSSRRHDIVFLKVRRVEAGGIRTVGEAELGSDALGVDLPLDQNGALYIVDWSTSEGHNYSLLLRDGAGRSDRVSARDETAGSQPAATVQVKQLQNQGRFIFVGYRVE